MRLRKKRAQLILDVTVLTDTFGVQSWGLAIAGPHIFYFLRSGSKRLACCLLRSFMCSSVCSTEACCLRSLFCRSVRIFSIVGPMLFFIFVVSLLSSIVICKVVALAVVVKFCRICARAVFCACAVVRSLFVFPHRADVRRASEAMLGGGGRLVLFHV